MDVPMANSLDTCIVAVHGPIYATLTPKRSACERAWSLTKVFLTPWRVNNAPK